MNARPVFYLLIFSCVGTTAAADDALPFLKTHCVRCHGEQTQESDLRLDNISTLAVAQQSKRWQQIFDKVNRGEMPPDDEPQPTEADRKPFLEWIAETHQVSADDPADHWSLKPMVRPDVPGDGHEDENPIDAFVRSRLSRVKLSLSPPADRATLLRRASLDLIGLPPSPEEVKAFTDDPASTEEAFAKAVDRFLQSDRYGERWAQHWLDVIRWAETVGFETNAERRNAWHYRDWVIRSLNDDKPYDRFVFEQIAGDTVGEDAALGFLVAGPANLPGQIGRDEEAMRQARQDELDEVIRTVSQSLFGLTIGCARCHDHKFDAISQADYYSLQAIFAGLTYGNRRLRGKENDQWTARLPQTQEQLKSFEQELAQFRIDHHLRPAVLNVQSEEFAPIRTDAVRMEIAATNNGAASLYELEVHAASANKQPSTNIALASAGAKSSASSFALSNQTRHHENLIDGSVDRRQAFPWVAEKGGPAWVQIEIPQAAEISKIIWHAGSSVPASYEVKVRDTATGDWKKVADSHDRLPAIDDRRKAEDVHIEGVSNENVDRLVQLLANIRRLRGDVSRLSAGPQTYAALFNEHPDPTWLLRRGDPMQRERQVPPVVPAVLDDGNADVQNLAIDGEEASRRLRLANHLARPDHPLATRVIVNRIWQHHFGMGIVETSSDFGKMGALPTHPDLLDWLSLEFVANGRSIKWLHRTIVNSSTYRQSSFPRPEAIAVDADSRLLWRYPPRRLDAEAIRDSILAVSGKLSLKMYGRGFDFFDRRGGLSDYTSKEVFDESGWRRMVYAHKIRMQSIDIFGALDCPDAGQMTPRRNRSITPIQSLGMFNSPFTNRQAKFFAERSLTETDDSIELAVDRCFQLVLCRPPTEAELGTLIPLAKQHGLHQVCRVLLNSSEFVFLR